MYWLGRFLSHFVRWGRLVVIDADGATHEFGPGKDNRVTVVLKSRALPWRLRFNPRMALGEAYMDGTFEVRDGSLWDFLDLCGRNLALAGRRRRGWAMRLAVFAYKHFAQFNSTWRARRNVAHHYDLSRRLYESFLDPDMQYSCGYFAKPRAGLEEAQAAKKRHVAAKLRLAPGQRVLDIGCGWGGLALDLARNHGVKVDGITLSEEQLAVARARAEKSGLDGAALFRFADYREMTGRYDRIVSVGMFEHVGLPYYPVFFRKIFDLLTPDGVALVHAIGSLRGPGIGNPWVGKYIFPGGYVPALSEVMPAIEKSGLLITDIEVLRLHYAETLRLWRERFCANWHRIGALYDERFRRMWEFYLAGCEMSFRHEGLMVFQIQLARKIDAVPITRDYIQDAEQGQRPSGVRTEAA